MISIEKTRLSGRRATWKGYQTRENIKDRSHIRDDPYIITEEDERLSERPVHH